MDLNKKVELLRKHGEVNIHLSQKNSVINVTVRDMPSGVSQTIEGAIESALDRLQPAWKQPAITAPSLFRNKGTIKEFTQLALLSGKSKVKNITEFCEEKLGRKISDATITRSIRKLRQEGIAINKKKYGREYIYTMGN